MFPGLSSILSGLDLKMEKPEKPGEFAPGPGGPNPPPAPEGPGPEAAAALPVSPLEINSEALLGGRSEIRIRHRGEIYRLTLTRAGKLILHK